MGAFLAVFIKTTVSTCTRALSPERHPPPQSTLTVLHPTPHLGWLSVPGKLHCLSGPLKRQPLWPKAPLLSALSRCPLLALIKELPASLPYIFIFAVVASSHPKPPVWWYKLPPQVATVLLVGAMFTKLHKFWAICLNPIIIFCQLFGRIWTFSEMSLVP